MAQCLQIVMVVRSLLFVYYFHCCWLLGSCQGLELQQTASRRAASSVDYCQSKPCQNGGLCSSGETTYTCYCQDTDYEGTNCNSWINDCQPNPCQNGGKCTDGLRSYTCDCSMTDFYGANCQNRIDNCMPNRCQNGAACIDGFRNYTCNCYDGFSGPDCSVDYEDCTPHLCKNEGRCLEISNQKYYGLAGYPPPFNGTFNYSMAAGYICWCPSGAYGTHCEINPNDCLDPATNRSVCVHASSCTDGLASFTCHCLPGYEGSNCSREIDECRSLPPPCPSGATCIDRLADFECANCPAGLGGRKCSVSLTGCDSNWCQNGATCQPILLQEFPTPLHDYRCVCSLERSFTGRNCSVQLPDFAFGLDGNASSASFLSLNPADSNFTANNSWTIELRLVTLSRGAFLLLLGDLSDSATTPRLLATIDHSGRLSAQLLRSNGSHIAALTSSDSVATGSFASVKISVSISGRSLSLSVSSSVRSASLSSASPLPQLSGQLIIGGFSGAKAAPAPPLSRNDRSRRSVWDPNLSSSVANVTAFRGIIGSTRINGIAALLLSPAAATLQDSFFKAIKASGSTNVVLGKLAEKVCERFKPCKNGATCHDIFYNNFVCECHSGYHGKDCSKDIPDCDLNPCGEGFCCFEKSNASLYNSSNLPSPFNSLFRFSRASGSVCLPGCEESRFTSSIPSQVTEGALSTSKTNVIVIAIVIPATFLFAVFLILLARRRFRNRCCHENRPIGEELVDLSHTNYAVADRLQESTIATSDYDYPTPAEAATNSGLQDDSQPGQQAPKPRPRVELFHRDAATNDESYAKPDIVYMPKNGTSNTEEVPQNSQNREDG